MRVTRVGEICHDMNTINFLYWSSIVGASSGVLGMLYGAYRVKRTRESVRWKTLLFGKLDYFSGSALDKG